VTGSKNSALCGYKVNKPTIFVVLLILFLVPHATYNLCLGVWLYLWVWSRCILFLHRGLIGFQWKSTY